MVEIWLSLMFVPTGIWQKYSWSEPDPVSLLTSQRVGLFSTYVGQKRENKSRHKWLPTRKYVAACNNPPI